MKLRLYIGGLIAFSVLFSSCGKDSEEGESFNLTHIMFRGR